MATPRPPRTIVVSGVRPRLRIVHADDPPAIVRDPYLHDLLERPYRVAARSHGASQAHPSTDPGEPMPRPWPVVGLIILLVLAGGLLLLSVVELARVVVAVQS